MEKFYKVLVISMLIQLASFFVSYSGENNPQINGIGDSGLLLNNSSLGTDFWISIPKNSPLWGWTEGYININITSIANTRVMIYDAEFGKTTTKDVEAYQMVTLSTKTGELNMNSEITDGEQVLNKALRITADDPIIVQVINYTANSSYGYTAIPVSQWGNEYYHSGYYDYNYSWYSYSVKNAGGFIIIASENSTKITVELKGIGKGMAKTTGGNDIGNILKATLNEGDVYMVRGDGLTKGLYDLTGSRITSTLPVGVISFHNGTTIPSFYTWGYGSDALAEMMMPVQAWGTKFATVQYDRSPTMGAESQGDFFRVIGSAANTHVSCQYFDVTDGKFIGQPSFTIKNPGEFYEAINDPPANPNKLKSIRGISYWSSDYPVNVLQYAYSTNWDNDADWNSGMSQLFPVEQFVSGCVFQVPQTKGYSMNTLTLLAVGDPADPEMKLLKSITFDGKPINVVIPQIVGNNVPGTSLYWGRLFVESGAHKITGNTLISGIVNGNNASNTYANPISCGTNKIDQTDKVQPKITRTENCGVFTVTASEETVGQPVTEQIDQGISKIILIKELSTNYQLKLDKPESFKPNLKMSRVKFFLTPIDSSIAGKAVFAVLDRAGNYSVDSITFNPEAASFNTNPLDFQKLRVNQTANKSTKLKNTGVKPIQINEVKLNTGVLFKITNANLPVTLAPGEEIEIGISYTPNSETGIDSDKDTVTVKSICGQYSMVVIGQSIIPKIAVNSEDFGKVDVNKLLCLEELNGNGLKISNPGGDTLTVTNIQNIAAPFSINNPTPLFPFKVAPGEDTYFKSICFLPRDSGNYSVTLSVLSDAMSGSGTFTVKGLGFKKDTTGIEDDFSTEPEMNIYPNPAVNSDVKLEINGFSSEITEVLLTDITGRIIERKQIFINSSGSGSISLNTSRLASGMYFIKLTENGGSRGFVTKLMVVN